jgi:lipid A ethanolaminephosphotransferase
MHLPPITSTQSTLYSAGFITIFFNWELWHKIHYILSPLSLSNIPFLASCGILVFAVAHLICHIFAFGKLHRIWLFTLLLTSASAAFYQLQYHVLFDKTVIQSIFGTDYQEVSGLFNFQMILWIFFLGVLPAVLMVLWPTQKLPLKSQTARYAFGYIFSLGLVAAVAVVFYKDYASLLRNHREIKQAIIPSSFLYSTYGIIRDKTQRAGKPLQKIGEDAHLGAKWDTAKPVVFVLVVGETARRENFSLNGYPRNTNPKLMQEDIIFYDQTTSCGTATAISLPCMFARETRKEFDVNRAQYQENLLDVIMHAGLGVNWIDNNGGGCKGVCSRIAENPTTNTPDTMNSYEDMSTRENSPYCHNGECLDMALLENLPTKFTHVAPGKLIVIHQKGSHGPSYFERSPTEFKPFLPECRSNQLQRCTVEEITNAYDNSIVYTDHVLHELIQQLKSAAKDCDVAMLYLSDHGESLGKNGFYLHGFPYNIAPKEQIEIPMILWASEGYKTRFALDWPCLKAQAHQPLSQDNLFSSVLSLLNIQTQVYDTSLDFTARCQKSS